MNLVNFALRLLRLAGEALFLFEINRFLGRAVKGPIRHRTRSLPRVEATLLRQVRAPLLIRPVTLPSGLVIHTLVAGAAAAPSHDAAQHPGSNPLVLLHGHSMAGAFFAGNIDALIDIGYSSVFVPDLLGWGRSSRPKFIGQRAEEAVDFFLSPLVTWLDILSLPTFVICGHSLGAYLAHEYASRYPQRVRRLILTSPAAITRHTPVRTAAWFAFTPQRFLTHGGLLAHIFFALRYPNHPEYNVQGMRELTLFINSVAHRSGDAAAAKMIRFWRVGTTRWQAECVRPLLERVGKLDCPIDLISGDNDALVHVEAVRALHRALAAVGNDVRLNVIAGADHTPHISAPVRFAKAIMRGMAPVAASSMSKSIGTPSNLLTA